MVPGNRRVDQNAIKNFLSDLVRLYLVHRDSTRFAVVVYNQQARIEFDFDDYSNQADIISSIENIQFTGNGFNLTDALYRVRTELYQPSRGDRPGVPNIAYLFIAERPTGSGLNIQATLLRGDGIGAIALGFGRDVLLSDITRVAWKREFARRADRLADLPRRDITGLSYTLLRGE